MAKLSCSSVPWRNFDHIPLHAQPYGLKGAKCRPQTIWFERLRLHRRGRIIMTKTGKLRDLVLSDAFLLHHYPRSSFVAVFWLIVALHNINLRLTISREIFMQICCFMFGHWYLLSFSLYAHISPVHTFADSQSDNMQHKRKFFSSPSIRCLLIPFGRVKMGQVAI